MFKLWNKLRDRWTAHKRFVDFTLRVMELKLHADCIEESGERYKALRVVEQGIEQIAPDVYTAAKEQRWSYVSRRVREAAEYATVKDAGLIK